mgnify:CR=1 FL=1
MKICKDCKKSKPLDEYVSSGAFRHNLCHPCRRVKQNVRNKERAKKLRQPLW